MDRPKRLRTVLLAAIAASAAPLARPAAAGAGGEGKTLMKDLSSAFEGIGRAIHAQDAAGARFEAGELAAAAARLEMLEPERNKDLAAGFRALEIRVAELAAEIASLAEQRDLAGAGQALEEVRVACVTCHARFRSGNRESGLFPARGATVLGTVRLHGPDGVERPDRSNVVVFLEGGPRGSPRLPRRNPALSQRGRQFSPRVLPV